MRGSLLVDHCHVNDFICILNFRGWSQPLKFFTSKIFPIYDKYVYTLLGFSMIYLLSTKY